MRILALGLCVILGAASGTDLLGFVPGASIEDVGPDLRVVGAMNDGLLVVGPASALDARAATSLATISRDDGFWLAYALDPASRATIPGLALVLRSDGEQYLLKAGAAGLESLRQLRVMLAPVNLAGWHRGSTSTGLPPVAANPLIQQMADAVEPDSVLAIVRRLQDFQNRYSTGDSGHAAAAWIADWFRESGADTVIIQYHRPGHAPNVIAVKYGTTGQRNPYAIICGHLDSYSTGLAPGADDNASGTAAAMEAFRVMRNSQFRNDLRFIGWSGEEFGLYGSEAYADEARSRGDSILGVLNFDMIGYVDHAPEDLQLVVKRTNPPCEPFGNWFAAIADTYTTLPCTNYPVNDNQNSDHGPFWDNGYVALTGIEDFWPTNPHYHTSHDSIGAGYNDNDFCSEVTRAGVAALATLGEPLPLNQPMVVLGRTRLDDSGGNNNGRWDPGETVDLYLLLRNVGLVNATSVSATVATTDSFVTVLEPTRIFGDITGGDSAENVQPFEVRADIDTPREHLARFDLTVSSAETTWQSGFGITVGPYLVTDPIPDGPRQPARYWAYDDVDTGYIRTPVFDWVEINQAGTRIEYAHNDDVEVVPLPVEFGPLRFYGEDFDRVSVSADGWLCPGTYTSRQYSNRGLPDPQNPPGLICPNWDDLYPGEAGSGHVYYRHDAADHRFVIEYDSVAYYSPRSVRDKFQVLLYDSTVVTPTGDNLVVVQHLTANNYSSSTVGIQDQTREIAIQVLFDNGYAPGAAPVTARRAVAYAADDPTGLAELPGNYPADGPRLSVPNPVTGRAVVRLELARAARIRLGVFDRTGRRLEELVSASAPPLVPGEHDFTLDATGLARGIYFLLLETDRSSRAAKVTVIR